jgi:hypothetical protein
MNTMAGPASPPLLAPRPTAAHRLQLMMRQRERLHPPFASVWDHLAARFEPDELEAWSAGVLDLAEVNAGPSCLMAFWTISKSQPAAEGVAPLVVAAHAAAEICRGHRRTPCLSGGTDDARRRRSAPLVAHHG